jgi:hypothetical protein
MKTLVYYLYRISGNIVLKTNNILLQVDRRINF